MKRSVWSVQWGQSHPQWQWQGGTAGRLSGFEPLPPRIQPNPKATATTARWVSIRPPTWTLEYGYGGTVHVPSFLSLTLPVCVCVVGVCVCVRVCVSVSVSVSVCLCVCVIFIVYIYIYIIHIYNTYIYIYIIHIYILYTYLYMIHIFIIYSICSLHIHYIFIKYLLYIHYTFIIYSLYIHYIFIIRRPLPTAGGARQRSNCTQQVVNAASVKVPTQDKMF